MNQILVNRTIPKQSVFIATIFVMLYFIKTQFYNLVIYILDLVLFGGKVSDIFTYNYTGQLIGCSEVLEAQNTLGDKSDLFYGLVPSVVFAISLVAWVFLIKRAKTMNVFDVTSWILLAIFSFSLIDALEFLYVNMQYFHSLNFNAPPRLVLTYLRHFIILILAIILCFKYMNARTRLRTVLIALPSFVVGFILWNYVGRIIMPIVFLELM